MKRMRLVGMVKCAIGGEDSAATPQNYHDVGYFTDQEIPGSRKVIVTKSGDAVKVRTKMGTYMLQKHDSQNYWHGTLNGVKVHVILKKMVGEIIYWA